jgi:hypothetical protein
MITGDTCVHRGPSGYSLCEYLVSPRGRRVNTSGAQLHELANKAPLKFSGPVQRSDGPQL